MPIKDENVVENMILGSWNRTQNENGQYTDLNLGDPALLTFTYLSDVPTYYGSNPSAFNELTTFEAFNASQVLAADFAMQAWSDVANVDFIYTEGASEITFGNISLTPDKPEDEVNARAFIPSGIPLAIDGDLWLDNSEIYRHTVENADPVIGSRAFRTIIHELGHALGLDHTPVSEMSRSSQLYAILRVSAEKGIEGGFAETPMLYDIAAMQHLYGARAANTLDNVYMFSATGVPTVKTIWDTGGEDWIDASNQTKGVTIDLNPGAFSAIGTSDSRTIFNIAIAFSHADFTVPRAMS